MIVPLEWPEIALRLALTVLAGGIIGFNRGEQGRPAGLRTTILVCLAASLSTILANLLLHLTGNLPDHGVQMDPMRLPLGVLTGMGFIGAGAILRRENVVMGVTTAATLWLVTIIGICIGTGFKMLGMVATALAMFVLLGLKEVERRLPQDRRGRLILVIESEGPSDDEVRQKFESGGFTLKACTMLYNNAEQHRQLTCDLRWRALPDDASQPEFLAKWAQLPGVVRVEWIPADISGA